jgi:hypothetical protein
MNLKYVHREGKGVTAMLKKVAIGIGAYGPKAVGL